MFSRRPHPRLRRFLRRSAILAAIACALLWLAGHIRPCCLAFHNTTSLNTARLMLNSRIGWAREHAAGRIAIPRTSPIVLTLTVCNRGSAVLTYRGLGSVPFDPTRVPLPNFSIPFWLLIGAFSGLALLLRRQPRRERGLCPKCDYDLAGLPPGTPCPECGRETKLKAQTANLKSGF